MTSNLQLPPKLEVQTWLNTTGELSLEALRGKVVAIFAFQMLCPGCVELSIPQARRVHEFFSQDDLVVIGLHTVFEHHEAMTEVSLKAFLHEYRVEFPVAIDMPSDDPGVPLPKTMQAYQMGGTPTLILIDRKGFLRKHKMGHEQELIVGAEIMALIGEDQSPE
jgi:hypothetical protein